MNASSRVASIYDLRGLKCPMPVLKTRHRLSSLEVGAGLEVLSDDPLARIDLAVLCENDGHNYMCCEHEGFIRFSITKGG